MVEILKPPVVQPIIRFTRRDAERSSRTCDAIRWAGGTHELAIATWHWEVIQQP